MVISLSTLSLFYLFRIYLVVMVIVVRYSATVYAQFILEVFASLCVCVCVPN